MSNLQITNGVIKYGRTVKTGDFEGKRADVELSFTVAEGEDAENVIERVQDIAQQKCEAVLGFSVKAKPAKESAAKEEAKPAAGKAKKIPAVASDAADVVEDPAASPAKAAPKASVKTAEIVDDDPLGLGIEEDIGDIYGTAPVAKEITDKELNDATQKCQNETRNPPAIRKCIADAGVKTPPGRLIDIAQDKRAAYLESLKTVKPLA